MNRITKDDVLYLGVYIVGLLMVAVPVGLTVGNVVCNLCGV